MKYTAEAFDEWWFTTQFDRVYWQVNSQKHQTEYKWAKLAWDAARRDLLAEVERLRGHIKTFQKIFPARLNEARRMGQVDANKSWEEGHIYGKEQERLRKEDNAVFTEEIMKLEERLQAAQAFAAYLQEVIADKELLVGQERKRVARECAEIAEMKGMNQDCSDAWFYAYGKQIAKTIVDTIRDRYGVD